MAIEKIKIKNGVLVLFIAVAAATRLLKLGDVNSIMNFSPLGAMALFGGCYFTDRIKAFLIPLITLAISDIFIYHSYFHKWIFFYEGSFWVYLSFALMVWIGTAIKRVSVKSVAIASIATIFIHWTIADIQPWLYGDTYEKTIGGYMKCLIMAIPFERNLLLGNIVFGLLMFGGFELTKRRVELLKPEKNLI